MPIADFKAKIGPDIHSKREKKQNCPDPAKTGSGLLEKSAAKGRKTAYGMGGVPEVIRTPDLPLRRRSLYPAELRKQTRGGLRILLYHILRRIARALADFDFLFLQGGGMSGFFPCRGAVKKVPINKRGAGLTGVDIPNDERGDLSPPHQSLTRQLPPRGSLFESAILLLGFRIRCASKKVDILLTKEVT